MVAVNSSLTFCVSDSGSMFQSTLLIPLNARLALSTAAELDDELDLVIDNEDIEDDTL